MPVFIKPQKMVKKPTFASSNTEVNVLTVEKDGVQRNIYIDAGTDKELRDETNVRKDTQRGFNVSRLLIEAWTVYKLAKRFHNQSKSNQSIYEFTLDALQTFVDRKPLK